MSFSIVGSGTVNNNQSSTNTGSSFTLPTVQNGDYCVVICGANIGGQTCSISGFTATDSSGIQSGTVNRIYTFYKKLTSGDSSSSVSPTWSSSGRCPSVWAVVRGVNGTYPGLIDSAASTTSTSLSTYTSSDTPCLVVGGIIFRSISIRVTSGSAPTITQPSGYTAVTQSKTNFASGVNVSVALCYATVTGPSTSAGADWSFSPNGREACAMSFVLNEPDTSAYMNTTTTWTCPTGVTSVDAYVWGAGGGGGSGPSTGAGGGGGGGGGAFSFSAGLPTTPSVGYTVTAPSGGAGGTPNNDGTTGSDSWFNTSSTIKAVGGTGGVTSFSGGTGSAGGSAGSGIGTTKYSGGTGGTRQTSGGGGGGGAAGTTGNGATGGDAGVGVAGVGGAYTSIAGAAGGAGGQGTGSNKNGNLGQSPGGGGGGGAGSAANGAQGGTGAVFLVYNFGAASNMNFFAFM